jgi:hypothetical protein
MAQPQEPLPAGGRKREEAALLEIEHTTISPGIAGALLAFFLVAIVAVPVAELFAVRARGEGLAIAWSHLSVVPDQIRAHGRDAPDSSVWNRIVSANRIVLTGLTGFERALENESLIGRSLRPPAQLVMTGWLGAGNERVYPGRDSWLFYRQDVEYVTAPGFLEPGQIRRRIRATPEWAEPPRPDPREAIARFNDDLAMRGIALIVMPTPVKPGIHPEKLDEAYGDDVGVLQNPSFASFIADLKRQGVRVFDPSDALAAGRSMGPQYLTTDTHWRPESMELVADLLAAFISMEVRLPVAADPGYRVERLESRNIGDVARMLDLPDDQALFPHEMVWLRRILQPDGSLWRSSRDADVLLLGDSFSNIYSLESMGWGTSAGFAEQLSFVLRRPIDRIVQNDEGAFAARAILARDPRRLDGKRVVVYQFAERELAFGDWKIIGL